MKLSIIVPVYNLEQYISAALDSLLSIRFSYDYEILLINDGSTDRSEEIIRQYAAAHRSLFHSQSGGLKRPEYWAPGSFGGVYCLC